MKHCYYYESARRRGDEAVKKFEKDIEIFPHVVKDINL
jgi:hypothetical protein